MSSDDLRVAVIGYGLAGSVFHAPFVSATPGLRLAAVVTGNAERQAKVRHDYPDVRVVESVDRLWERASDYDLVVIGAPNGTHASLAHAGLAAGLHVVVDKPFAVTAAEGQGVIDEARRRGRLVIPFHNRRWDGDLRTVRRLMAEGALGDVWRFESRFERWRGEPKPRWCVPEALTNGEGMLHDIGTHLIDQALLLFGPVRRVYAELDARLSGVVTEDDALICLTHANGVRSRLWPSAVAAQSGPRFAVYGSKAAYIKFGLDPQEDAMRAGHGPPSRADWGEEPEERWGTLGVGNERHVVRTEPGDYKHFYAGVVLAITDGAPPPVAPEDAVTGLAIIEAARRSAADGCAVTL
jgi:predicted dehydrogenase